jgi:hypothetical protein
MDWSILALSTTTQTSERGDAGHDEDVLRVPGQPGLRAPARDALGHARGPARHPCTRRQAYAVRLRVGAMLACFARVFEPGHARRGQERC